MEKVLLNFLLDLNDKGLINNHDFDYEKVAQAFANKDEFKQLHLHDVVGQSEQLVAFCRWYNQVIPSYETTEEEIVETYLRENN